MGIQDRDYMRRPPDRDDNRNPSGGTSGEELLAGFLKNKSRFFVYVGVGVGVLAVIALMVAMLS